MKKALLLYILLSALTHYSQKDRFGCGVKTPGNFLQWRDGIIGTQDLVDVLKHDTCMNKKFSIAFHVVLDSNYLWGGLTPADLDASVASLNNVFKPICVSFANCYVDEIPNFSYNTWEKTATDNIVTPSWDLDQTINIYLVDSIVGFPAGYAYFPGGKDVIVIEKGSIVGAVTIHEMGHFFGLPHTFDEIGVNTGTVIPPPVNPQIASYEFFRRTNCYDHGDGFCDTEADCYPSGYDKDTPFPCKHVPGSFDGYGDFYVPPVDNYMTYFKCGCRFTQEQYNWMAYVILTQRRYLH